MNVPPDEASRREELGLNWTYMLDTAINNLHRCLWFGILEDLDRSLELFRYQTGLDTTAHRLNHKIRNGYNISGEELDKLKALMPMDVFLYDYARQLHQYRWLKYKQNWNDVSGILSYTPKFTEIIKGCKSTRSFISCPGVDISFNT